MNGNKFLNFLRGLRRKGALPLSFAAAALALWGGFTLLRGTFGLPWLSAVQRQTLSIAQLAFLFLFLGLIAVAGLAPRERLRGGKGLFAGGAYFYLAAFFFVSLSLIIGGYASYRDFEERFRAQAANQLSAVAELKLHDLTMWRKERLTDSSLLYDNRVFAEYAARYLQNPKDEEALQVLQSWLKLYEGLEQYDRARFWNAQGKPLFAIPEGAPLEPSPVVRQAVAQAAQSREIILTDFFRYHDNVYLALVIPILENGNPSRVIAYVSLRIDPRLYLYPYLNRWPSSSQTAETLLVRREGDEVLFLNPLRFEPDAALNLRRPLEQDSVAAARAVLGETGVIEGVDYRGERVMADLRPVPDSPWYLVSKMDMSEVYQPLRARLAQTVGLIALAIFACGSALLVLWRRQQISFYREQLESAEALRESEEKYRRLFNHMTLAVVQSDADGKPLSVNQAFARMFGYESPEDALANIQNLAEDIYADPNRRAEMMSLQAQSDSPKAFESLYRRRDGSVFWGRASLLLVRGEQNQIVRVEGIIEDVTERKQAMEELRRSEESLQRQNSLLAALLQSLPMGVFMVEAPTGKPLIANDAARALLGRGVLPDASRENLGEVYQAYKAETREPYPPDEMPILLGMKGIAAHVDDMVVVRPDGTETLLEVFGAPVADERGNVWASLVSFFDVTERKRMENELLRRLVELKALYENGLALSSLRDPREIGKQTVETLLRNMDWLQVSVRLRKDDSDELELIAFSQRGLAESELAQAEEKMKTLVSRAGQGLSGWVIQTGKTLRIGDVLLHPYYVAVIPEIRSGLYAPLKVGGRTIGCVAVESERRDAFSPQDERFLTTLALQTAVALENVRLYQDLQKELRERRRAEVEVRLMNERLEQRVQERTRELKDAQEKIVRQERLATLGQLAGSVGHELRNPLGVISNAAYFLKMALTDAPPKVKEYLEIIESETRASDKIVADLLDFTRVKSLERKEISLPELAEETLKRFPPPSSVQVSLDFPSDLPRAYADPQHVVQILGNLVVNAYQAMPQGGSVTIFARRADEDSLALSVRDTGCGVAPENIQKIFEPLFTTKTKGFGLGLAVCLKLAEANGGTIEARSEPGKGSEFSLRLPVFRG